MEGKYRLFLKGLSSFRFVVIWRKRNSWAPRSAPLHRGDGGAKSDASNALPRIPKLPLPTALCGRHTAAAAAATTLDSPTNGELDFRCRIHACGRGLAAASLTTSSTHFASSGGSQLAAGSISYSSHLNHLRYSRSKLQAKGTQDSCSRTAVFRSWRSTCD